MKANNDIELLRSYAIERSEEAFREIVERHGGFVYSTALRYVRDPHVAEEVSQAVFIALAQKAGQLKPGVILAGWLFQATRFAAGKAIRTENRRQRRLQEAARMENTNPASEADQAWAQITPLLNEALGQLAENDRLALLLRFFQEKKLEEVGESLGISADAAKMRVSRALEKLRGHLSRRGVALPLVVITAALSAHAAQAAPAGLSASLAAIAAGHAASSSASTATLVKGTLKLMAWTKAKTAIAAGVTLLLAGTATVTVSMSHSSSTAMDAKVRKILVEKMSGNGNQWNSGMEDLWKLGTNVIPSLAAESAFSDTVVSKEYGRIYAKSPAFVEDRLPAPMDRAQIRMAAMRAILELGALAARRAAPQVIDAMSREESDPNVNADAIRAASWLLPNSPAALAAIKRGLSNTNLMEEPASHLFLGVDRIPWLNNPEESPWRRTPELFQYVTNFLTNAGHAYMAAIDLAEIGSNGAPAIPALIQVADIGAAGSFPDAKSARLYKGKGFSTTGPHLTTFIQNDKGMNHNRAMALETLGRIGVASPEVRAALVQAWDDPDPWVRQHAATAVRLLGPPLTNNLTALLPGLADPDAQTMGSKLQAIANLGPGGRDVLDALRLLSDPQTIQSILTNLPPANSIPRIQYLADDAKFAICQIDPEEGRRFLPEMAARMTDEYGPFRFDAIKPGPLSGDIVRLLEPMLEEAGSRRQSAAAYVILLHDHGNAHARDVLRRNKADGSLRDRITAGDLLLKTLGETDGLTGLIEEAFKTTDDSAFNGGYLAGQLSKDMGEAVRPCLPVIKEALWSPNETVRREAGTLILKYAPEELPINTGK